MSKGVLIRGGWVLTLGARTPNFAQADVLVEEGRISEVGPGLRARGAQLIDATEAIVRRTARTTMARVRSCRDRFSATASASARCRYAASLSARNSEAKAPRSG